MPVASILVVEDDAVALQAMAALLREEGYAVSTASDGLAALAVAERDTPSLVITDLRMPRADGFQLVKRLRARPATSGIPILLMSAQADPGRRVLGFDLGADDFIMKPIDVGELLARVRVQLRRAAERDALERRSVLDPLTGVLNRRGITAVLHQEQQRARRLGSSLSVLMVDVDHFKAINDTHGHQAGDTVLRHVGRTLVEAVRLADHVGRFGGDEFVVALPDTQEPAAAILAQRLRRMKHPPLAIEPTSELTISVSIGVATMEKDETIDALVERADREMYRMKHTGEMPVVKEEDLLGHT